MTTTTTAGREHRELVALLKAAPAGWKQIEPAGRRYTVVVIHAPRSAESFQALCGAQLARAEALTAEGIREGRLCQVCKGSAQARAKRKEEESAP